jgi:hypothetical protein
MAYLRYFDQRYGDLYEVYFDDTGKFESAMRSTGDIGRDPIYYASLNELPIIQREQIEYLIWRKLHPNSKHHQSSPNDG